MSTDQKQTKHDASGKAIEEKAESHAKQPEKSHMHSKDAATPKDQAEPKDHAGSGKK